MVSEIEKIMRADKEKKLIKGFKESLKAVKLGAAAEIFVTKTCPDSMKMQLKEASELSNVKLTDLDLTPEALSAQLKKPYTITVAAITTK